MFWEFQIGKTSLYSPINTPLGGMIYHRNKFMKKWFFSKKLKFFIEKYPYICEYNENFFSSSRKSLK